MESCDHALRQETLNQATGILSHCMPFDPVQHLKNQLGRHFGWGSQSKLRISTFNTFAQDDTTKTTYSSEHTTWALHVDENFPLCLSACVGFSL